MSYFSGTEDQAGTQKPETPPEDPNRDYLTELKTAKGEAFVDPRELAKGYVHSQEHINNLSRQIEEMREDLGKQDYMKEVLAAIEAKQSTPPTSGEQPQTEIGSTNKPENQPADVDAIKAQVLEELKKAEKENTAAQNLQLADRRLTELFGTNAQAHVGKKAQELGMNKDSLRTLASESPSAFLALIGVPAEKQTNATPRTGMNTEADLSTGGAKRNYEYYSKLRKADPKMYYSGRTQNQMLEDRQEQGQGFYG